MADIPPPQPSPRLNVPAEGEQAVVMRHDTQELPVLKKEMKKAFRINEVFTIVMVLAGAAGSLLGGYTVFIDKAEAAGTKAAKQATEKSQSTAETVARVQSEFTAHVEVESHARIRMEKKINAILDKFDVPDPAPTPKDGGK